MDKQHGDSRKENRAGQIAIRLEDYVTFPEILESYDRLSKSPNRSRRTGNEVIVFEKYFEDGYIYLLSVGERDKRKSLSSKQYIKRKGN